MQREFLRKTNDFNLDAAPKPVEPKIAEAKTADPAANVDAKAEVPAAAPVAEGASADAVVENNAKKANEASEKAGKELDTKVKAIEDEVNKAVDDQNSKTVAGA